VDGATKLLHWDAMRLFRNLGVERYDFSGARIDPEKGSKQEKLAMYKRELGGRLVQGYIWKYPLQPLKFAVYSYAVRFQRGGDIVDQEKHKLNRVLTCLP
jgi:lipid II:glycine glycyltransferase (peptidoglycan interpeptide bridge formation enzyme)